MLSLWFNGLLSKVAVGVMGVLLILVLWLGYTKLTTQVALTAANTALETVIGERDGIKRNFDAYRKNQVTTAVVLQETDVAKEAIKTQDITLTQQVQHDIQLIRTTPRIVPQNPMDLVNAVSPVVIDGMWRAYNDPVPNRGAVAP